MKFLSILRAVLREVFEEAAYERFCARESIGIGRESYARFLRETEHARRKKVSCC
jgi:hypothetical protein